MDGTLDYKERWVLKNWCFWTAVLEKTLESPLDCKEIQPVHPKGDQFWVLIGRTDVEAETPVLWPPDVKSWLIWKDPDTGKDWRRQKKGTTEDEMVGWHHRLNGHGFALTPAVGDGQGGLVCCGPWGYKKSDMTEWLNWTELNRYITSCRKLAGGAFFLPPSDVYVRSFLYFFYTLIKLYYKKLWEIKPHHWPNWIPLLLRPRIPVLFMAGSNSFSSGSILGPGRSSGGGHGNPLQYSCLENPMDRGASWATPHRVTKSKS